MTWTLFCQIVALIVLVSLCISFIVYSYFDDKAKFDRKVNK